MSNLQRADDADGPEILWDQASAAATSQEPTDRRTPPAAERVFASLSIPWDRQIVALGKAMVELEGALVEAERLAHIDEQLVRSRRTETAARQDLAEIVSQRQTAIARAVSDAGPQSRLTRKRRLEEIRTITGEAHDAKYADTARLARQRLHTAEREQVSLREERETITARALVSDPEALRLVRELAEAVSATLTRDRAARAAALGDWARLRGTDERILGFLRESSDGTIIPGVAFGEGPIHLVAGQKLLLVELRRGRDGIRTEEVDGDLRLVQVLAQADQPLGLTNGSTAPLERAARTVQAAIDLKPEVIICVSAWLNEPQTIADLTLCGPDRLAEVIEAVPDTNINRDQMRDAARALALLPLPEPTTPPVASLDHLTTIRPEDVPDGIPSVRDLIVFAHERRHDAA